MNTISNLTKVRTGLVVLALMLLSGCASTGGAPGALGATAPAGYAICDGGHASRLPGREQLGRVCQPATALKFML
jgi:hypothetical protein